MRKVELRMNEQLKYETIKKLVETNGNKKRAAVKLHCTVRTINRLIHRYKEQGKAGFVHGNRGRIPSTAYSLEDKTKIINLYTEQYSDTNIQHFSEIIYEDLGIKISSHTILNWLYEEDILSPKAHKKTKKALKRKLKKKLDETKSEKVKNEIKESITQLDSSEAHPRRPRCKYFGEMIQSDASSYEWIPDTIWHLHVGIDDATGTVVGAYFDYQETLNGYYHMFYQILTNYGIPAMFYTDRRTVFEYKRKNSLMDDDDTFTQFSYACHQLGTDIKTTSVAQAKGRVERLNQTLQSRLPVELRRANVKTIDEANEFLKSYLPKFNDLFALHLNSTKSVFETQPDADTINKTLAVLAERKIDNGHSIRYKNNYYIPVDKNGMQVYFLAHTNVLVIEAYDKQLLASINDDLYALNKIEQHEKKSKSFDLESKEADNKKSPWIPPMNHPWRLSNYRFFKNSMQHRQ